MAWVNCTEQECYTFSRGLAEGCLPTDSSDTSASAPSRLITIASKSWSNGKKTGCFPGFRFGMTPRRSTGDRGADSLMSSQRDFPVSHSASPDSSGARMTNGICGPTQSESFAKWDREARCWRTPQVSLLTRTTEPFSGTWPRAGLMLRGEVYRRLSWERRISEIGCGFLPTPQASDANVGQITTGSEHLSKTGKTVRRVSRNGIEGSAGLARTVMFPTPYGLSANQGQGDGEFGKAIRNWPTPNAAYAERKGADYAKAARGAGGDDLQTAVMKLHPTPTSRDWRSGKGKTQAERGRTAGPSLSESQQGRLNPDWVEWLMNWPIGWTSLTPMESLDWPSGDWWREEPPIPRVTDKTENRVDRLKALGNGQVPIVAATAWELLTCPER